MLRFTWRCDERSTPQTSAAAITTKMAMLTVYHGVDLAISWVMGLPRPSVHGLAFVQSTPRHMPSVLRARR